jgi:cysteine peptidase C11 family protein
MRQGVGYSVLVALAYCLGTAPAMAQKTYSPCPNDTVKSSAKWTFGFWINGSHGLEADSKKAVMDLEHYGSSAEVNVVIDASHTEECYPGLECKGDYDGLYEILPPSSEQRSAHFRKEDCMPDLPKGKVLDLSAAGKDDALDIGSFVEFLKRKYSADHTAIVFGTHGGAFRGEDDDPEMSGYRAIFGTNGNAVLTHDIESVLTNAVPTLSPTADLIGFDSCLMGTVEVAYAFRHLAKAFVASENKTPSRGWDYSDIVNATKENSSWGPLEVGRYMRKTFVEPREAALARALVHPSPQAGQVNQGETENEKPLRIGVIDMSMIGEINKGTTGAALARDGFAQRHLAVAVNRLGAILTAETRAPGEPSRELRTAVDTERRKCTRFGYRQGVPHGSAVDVRCLCQRLKLAFELQRDVIHSQIVEASSRLCESIDLAESSDYNVGWKCDSPNALCDRGVSVFYPPYPSGDDGDVDGYLSPDPGARGPRPSFVLHSAGGEGRNQDGWASWIRTHYPSQ